MIKHEDWLFVSDFSDDHQDNAHCADVKWAILRLVDKHPEERLEWAQNKLYETPRKGYTIRDIPEGLVETVGDHSLSAIELALDYIPAGDLRDKVQAMAAIHDLAEAAIGDFTPHDPITKPEKKRIEQITAEILFQKHPEMLELWMEFEHEQSDAAKIAHDIEKNQILFRVLDYVEDNPAYWDNLEDIWYAALNAPARTSVGDAMKADANSAMNKLLMARGFSPEISIHL